REQVGAVNRQVRCAVELFASRIEWRPLQRAAVLPAPLVRADRSHRHEIERLPEPEAIEHPHGVRPHVDTAADLCQRRTLFVHHPVETGLSQGYRDGETAEAGAHDGDAQRRYWCHDPATLHRGAVDEQRWAAAATARYTLPSWPTPSCAPSYSTPG